jgi:hypothetical protein
MHDGLMSESNYNRVEAEECKANSCDDDQDRSAWRFLAESWLLLAALNDIVESRKSIEVNSEAAPIH